MLIRPFHAARCEAAFQDAGSPTAPTPGEDDEWLAEADSVFRDIDGSAVRHLAAACRVGLSDSTKNRGAR